ncbi:MAG: hypothetical protein ACTHL8_11065 [Burkholderiaceae bacterium]
MSVDEVLSVDEVDDELLALLSVELLFMLLDEEVDDVDDAPLFSELLPALSLLFIELEFASAGEVDVEVAAGAPVADEPSDDDDEDWAQATPITAAMAAEAAVTTSLVWKLRM